MGGFVRLRRSAWLRRAVHARTAALAACALVACAAWQHTVEPHYADFEIYPQEQGPGHPVAVGYPPEGGGRGKNTLYVARGVLHSRTGHPEDVALRFDDDIKRVEFNGVRLWSATAQDGRSTEQSGLHLRLPLVRGANHLVVSGTDRGGAVSLRVEPAPQGLGALRSIPWVVPMALLIAAGFPRRRRRRAAWLCAWAVAFSYWLVFLCMSTSHVLVDEWLHATQIEIYSKGATHDMGALSMLKGYHVLVALALNAFANPTRWAMRLASTVFAALGAAFFARASSNIGNESTRAGALRTLQFAILPPALPFVSLIYTDMTALAWVMAGVALWMGGRHGLAAVPLAASVVVRQTNVVWAAMVGIALLWERRSALRAGQFKQTLLQATPLLLLGAAFLAFVVRNRGVAVGARDAQVVGLHFGNVLLCLAVLGIGFLPLAGALLPALISQMRSGWRLWGVGIVVALVFVGGFEAQHPWNSVRNQFFMRNHLFYQVQHGAINRVLFLVVCLWGAWMLCAQTVRRPVLGLVYVASALMLIPSELIEPRYAFVPLALFQLVRTRHPPSWEWPLLAWNAALAAALIAAMVWTRFFP